jgi:hypothetical protein
MSFVRFLRPCHSCCAAPHTLHRTPRRMWIGMGMTRPRRYVMSKSWVEGHLGTRRSRGCSARRRCAVRSWRISVEGTEGKDERSSQASVTHLGWGGRYAGCSINGTGQWFRRSGRRIARGQRRGRQVKINQRGTNVVPALLTR